MRWSEHAISPKIILGFLPVEIAHSISGASSGMKLLPWTSPFFPSPVPGPQHSFVVALVPWLSPCFLRHVTHSGTRASYLERKWENDMYCSPGCVCVCAFFWGVGSSPVTWPTPPVSSHTRPTYTLGISTCSPLSKWSLFTWCYLEYSSPSLYPLVNCYLSKIQLGCHYFPTPLIIYHQQL